MSTTTHPTELRLALVFNGGVSLAVWMAGVTHEIDRLRRKEGPWRDLCIDANATVVVDIISGTSAGGLNGALLAASVAAGKPLPDGLRALWLDDAALTTGKLLNDTDDNPLSLLDGRYFTKTVSDAVGPIAGEVERPATPVTLFVTATATGGQQPRGTDSLGQRFDYEDHRRLYRFVADAARQVHHRDGGPREECRNDFRETRALVTAARASAGFPGAFAPEYEKPLLDAGVRVQPAPHDADHPTFLIDGGVLDNAPFGPVVEEMAHRPVTGPYRRILAYVVPSSGHRAAGGGVPANDVARLSPPLHAVISGSLSLPREVDFRSDVDELDDRLSVAQEAPAARLFERLRGNDGGRLRATAAELVPEYRRARAVDGVWRVRRVLRRQPLATDLGGQSRIDVGRLLESDNLWLPPAGAGLRNALDGPLWTWGISAAQQVVTAMLREVRDQLNGVPEAPHFANPTNVAVGLSTALNRILAIEEAVSTAIVERAHAARLSAAAGDEELAALLNAIFIDLRVREHLLVIVRAAAESYGDAAAVVERALAAEVLARAFAPPSVRVHTPPFDFVRIGPDIDSPLRELGQYAGAGDRKLFGTKVGHFGAFAAEGARQHDWLWGRLDAAAHLTRLVLGDGPDVARQVESVQRAILADEADRFYRGLGGAALLTRLAAAHQRVAGDDRELVRSFLRSDLGRTTAVQLATVVTKLLTHGRFDACDPAAPSPRMRTGAQRTLEAMVAAAEPEGLTLGNRTARALTGPLRGAFWRGLSKDPTTLASRMRTRLILMLVFAAFLVVAVGGLGVAVVALFASSGEVAHWTVFGVALAVIAGILAVAARKSTVRGPAPRSEPEPAPAAAGP
jgi:predicted acylesterase/phospholipase RssA